MMFRISLLLALVSPSLCLRDVGLASGLRDPDEPADAGPGPGTAAAAYAGDVEPALPEHGKQAVDQLGHMPVDESEEPASPAEPVADAPQPDGELGQAVDTKAASKPGKVRRAGTVVVASQPLETFSAQAPNEGVEGMAAVRGAGRRHRPKAGGGSSAGHTVYHGAYSSGSSSHSGVLKIPCKRRDSSCYKLADGKCNKYSCHRDLTLSGPIFKDESHDGKCGDPSTDCDHANEFQAPLLDSCKAWDSHCFQEQQGHCYQYYCPATGKPFPVMEHLDHSGKCSPQTDCQRPPAFVAPQRTGACLKGFSGICYKNFAQVSEGKPHCYKFWCYNEKLEQQDPHVDHAGKCADEARLCPVPFNAPKLETCRNVGQACFQSSSAGCFQYFCSPEGQASPLQEDTQHSMKQCSSRRTACQAVFAEEVVVEEAEARARQEAARRAEEAARQGRIQKWEAEMAEWRPKKEKWDEAVAKHSANFAWMFAKDPGPAPVEPM